MYTKEELSSMKYGELLKILKNLGIKGGRQKTGKVIELILQKQSAEPKTDEKSTPSSKSNTQIENVEGNITSDILCSESEIHPHPFLQVSPNSENEPFLQGSPNPENKERHMLSNPNRRRTRTFIISKIKEDISDSDCLEENERKRSREEKSLLEVSAVEESLLNISGCLSRSSTFIFEDDLPNDSLTTSLDVKCSLDSPSTSTSTSTSTMDNVKGQDKNNDQDNLPYSNVDLSCKEIQTAEDIEGMESGKLSSSPVNNSRNRRTIRRSLRGQLLVSKIYSQESAAPSLSVPIIENSTAELSEGNGTYEQQSSLPFEPKFSVPKSFDFSKNTSTAQKGSNCKSGIPRFVSNAKKLKMPNFAKIHENAFKKMEAFDEYVERKHTRTLKTGRIGEGREIASGKKNIEKRADKETSIKKLVFKENPRKKLDSPASYSSSTRRSSTMASLTKKTPTRNNRESSSNLAYRLKVPASLDKVSAHSTLVKENLPPTNILAKHRNPHGGKSDIALNRREILKKAVNRKPNVKSSAEIRASEKVFIKGVRTNRRFELQMARRGIAPT
ncbi:hypothetical protein Avbf_13316 [Armadillidium vulgare]|nr:hypothetical protein Avbf_13316 [Armadillidium vulgare]